MTTSVEAVIETPKPSDIPQIGSRKRVKVNGKFATLFVNGLRIERLEDYDTGKRRDWYRAKVNYGSFYL